VILEIPGLVSELIPGHFDERTISVACVRTTQPKYLVFGPDAGRPTWVVQFGSRDELERIHGILSRLHRMLPDVVAEPLLCAPWRDGKYVQIQSGLAGMPWFRLAARFHSRDEWVPLRGRALETLASLHSAVREVPEWSGSIRPGEELRRQLAACQGQGVTFSPQVVDRVGISSERLDGLGEIPCHWQHGDYCLNNILISRSGLAIIDFEEFGQTSMPWHDQIGLALSVHDLGPGVKNSELLREDLGSCLRTGSGWPLAPDHLPGFFLHHVLWRINQCRDRPTRARARAALVALVEGATASSGIWFSTSAGSPGSGVTQARR
jgi:hypothetical protein